MLIADESIETHAATSAVWALWSQVESWHAWDPDVAWSQLEGTFGLCARGVLKPAGGPKSRFVITELTAGRSFVTEARLPLARLRFGHALEAFDGMTRVRHRIEAHGPLARIFGALIGPGLRRGLPLTLHNLARFAEARDDKELPC